MLGSGDVGKNISAGLLRLGHEVAIGTRQPEKLSEWASNAGKGAKISSFQDTAKFGEIIFLCTKWEGTLNAIKLAGTHNFEGKIVVDVTNPLLFERQGDAPKPAVSYPESAGFRVQQWLAQAKVVKAFNAVPANYMTNPKMEQGEPDLLMCGDEPAAKKQVSDIAAAWGWREIADMGGIEHAHLLESLAILWIRYGFLNNHWTHAFKILKK